MKVLFYLVIIFSTVGINAYSEYISSKNIPNIPKKEYFEYSARFKKRKDPLKITYKNKLKKGYWEITETVYNKDVIVETKATLRLSDMICVYYVTREKQSFGTIERTFKLLDDVKLPSEENVFYMISFSALAQIGRAYPINEKRIQIKFPGDDKGKIKIYINNNGIKKIKINGENFEAYELELKISGFPFSSFIPKMTAYIENNNERKILMSKGFMMEGMDSVTLELTEYIEYNEEGN